jgi:hypothetical protein
MEPISAPGSPPVDERHRIARDGPVVLALYALVSVLFVWIYFRVTMTWTPASLDAYTHGCGDRQALLPIFRLRILMPCLAMAVEAITRADLYLVYRSLGAVSVFASLLVYRRYLANFVGRGNAAALSPLLIYPLLWNLVLLNRLYYPFDLPSLLFFIMGLDFIYRRNSRGFYAAFVLGILNRETAAFLAFVFILRSYREMPMRRLLLHMGAQAAIFAGLKYGISAAVGVHVDWFETTHLSFNRRVIGDMVTFRGNALKDWAKLLLSFGGLWLLLPFIWKRQPIFIRRSLLLVVPFLLAMLLRAVIDEMRDYIELVPVVLTPVVCSLAGRLRLPGPEDD